MEISNRLLESRVTLFLNKAPVVKENTPINEALDKLETAATGSVLVTDKDSEKLSGIITKGDTVKLRIGSKLEQAHQLASDDVVAIKENAKLWQLLKMINGENSMNRRFDTLPVVDSDDKPVGVITRYSLSNRLKSMAGTS